MSKQAARVCERSVKMKSLCSFWAAVAARVNQRGGITYYRKRSRSMMEVVIGERTRTGTFRPSEVKGRLARLD